MGKEMEDGGISFGVPKGELKSGYFDLILKQMYHLGLMISQPTVTYSNNDITLMVRYIISHIPGKEKRMELRKELEEELTKNLGTDVKNKSQEEKNRIIINTYLDFVGNIPDYLEEYMGISKENRLCIMNGVKEDGK